MQRLLVAFCFLLVLATCAQKEPSPDKLSLSLVSFDDLPGWTDDHQLLLLETLKRSCPSLTSKSDSSIAGIAQKQAAWKTICSLMQKGDFATDEAVRVFFTTYFDAYAARNNDGKDGLFTGYYEALLDGSTEKTERFNVPLYARPHDLISVNLGKFKTDLKGQTINGRVSGNELVPYDERSSIDKGSLLGRADILLYVDNPVDAFFLEIQGSGKVRLENGDVIRLGYDGTNGHAYTPIGRKLLEMNELARPVTMDSIRRWLAANTFRAREVMELNTSYVFFRKLAADEEGPIGAEKVALTPLRSLAVDPAFVPLGTVLWLDTELPDQSSFRHLMVAQDTGGAIKGPLRGDIFFGSGKQEEATAGAMQGKGSYYFLLPKSP